MAQNDAEFTDSIAALYDRHMAKLLFEPYADDLWSRFMPVTSGTLLEVAAGTGIATAALAKNLPAGIEIVATDLNQPMLDYAAKKSGMPRVRWQQADALALPFADAAFEAVACQFGIMFFPDRVAGLQEMRRVLKPGGLLVFSVWDRLAANPIMEAAVAGLAKRYPGHPSWFVERTPCGYHDPAVIRADLQKASFEDCTIETITFSSHVGSPMGPAVAFCQGTPMRGEIETLEPGGLDAATDAAAAEISRRFGRDGFDVQIQALVVETVK